MPDPAYLRGFRVDLAPLPDLARLRAMWLELESRADASFFQSWAWIGPWLRLICPAHIARLLTVECNGRLVGMGVLTERRRFFGLGPLHLRLHETGDRVLDDITIEYNGFLSEQGMESDVMEAAVAHLAHCDRRWLTLHFPGIGGEQIPTNGFIDASLDIRSTVRPIHYVDLDALRVGQCDYVASLHGAKTRANIRSTARRLAAQHGTTMLRQARDASEREEFFRGLVALHQAHWTQKHNRLGAFVDPRILRFHAALIAETGNDQGPQLFRIEAGDAVIGYNYTLAWRGVMYGYQLGIDYPRFASCGSPGQLAVAMTIQHALQRGYSRFELMAGDTSYKRALGMAENRMLWLTLDRRNWQSRLRRIWHSLRKPAHA